MQVCAKRTNIPGMKQYRGRRPSPYGTFRSRRPYMPPPFYSPMGYGYELVFFKLYCNVIVKCMFCFVFFFFTKKRAMCDSGQECALSLLPDDQNDKTLQVPIFLGNFLNIGDLHVLISCKSSPSV